MGQELKGFKITETYLKDVENMPPILGVKFSNGQQNFKLECFQNKKDGTPNKKIKNAFYNMGIEKIDNSVLFEMVENNISIFKDIEYEIVTEIDEQGYETVLYVNDPANPGGTQKLMNKEALMKKLGISQFENESDELPF